MFSCEDKSADYDLPEVVSSPENDIEENTNSNNSNRVNSGGYLKPVPSQKTGKRKTKHTKPQITPKPRKQEVLGQPSSKGRYH